MRWLSFVASFGLIVALSVGSVGCKKGGNNTTSGTGTEGTAGWGGLGDVTLKDGSVKQGKETTLSVKLNRKSGKKDKVTVKVNTPDKITAKPASKDLENDEVSQDFTISVAENADVGE